MLMRIYRSQTRKVLVFCCFALLAFLFVFLLVYQIDDDARTIWIIVGASAMAIMAISLFGPLREEWLLKRKVFDRCLTVEDDNFGSGVLVEEARTLEGFHALSAEVAVWAGEVTLRNVDRAVMEKELSDLFIRDRLVIENFLLTKAPLISAASNIVCLGKAAEAIENAFPFHRKGEIHDILITPFIVNEDQKIFDFVEQYQPSLIITIFCENDCLDGVKIIRPPCRHQTVRSAMEEQEFVF